MDQYETTNNYNLYETSLDHDLDLNYQTAQNKENIKKNDLKSRRPDIKIDIEK